MYRSIVLASGMLFAVAAHAQPIAPAGPVAYRGDPAKAQVLFGAPVRGGKVTQALKVTAPTPLGPPGGRVWQVARPPIALVKAGDTGGT